MGGSHSSQADRNRPNQPPQAVPPPAAPPSYAAYPPPAVYPGSGPQFYPVNPPPTTGQYYSNYMPQPPYPQAPAGYRPPAPAPPQSFPQAPYMPQQYGQVPRPPTQTQEYQTTATIRNLVNLKKPTLKLEPTSQPGVYSISFKFDASAPCRATTFVCGTEDVKRVCRITSLLTPAPAVSYDKGLEHKFPSTPGVASSHVVNTTKASAKDLTTAQSDTFPVIIRLEALTEEGASQGRSLEALEPGCELPPWVQSQTTYARLVKEDDGAWGLRVIKQKIWVKGTSYELQEIYGMEQNKPAAGGAEEGYEDLDGNECVICMSAPRDTTALPCRHMCMCHGCASALKTQTNKCPICRNEIDSLLHIKINKPGGAAGARPDGDGATTAT